MRLSITYVYYFPSMQMIYLPAYNWLIAFVLLRRIFSVVDISELGISQG